MFFSSHGISESSLDNVKIAKKEKEIMIISNIAFPYETFYQLPKTAFEAPSDQSLTVYLLSRFRSYLGARKYIKWKHGV